MLEMFFELPRPLLENRQAVPVGASKLLRVRSIVAGRRDPVMKHT